MLCAVVPAKNEEKGIKLVLNNLLATSLDFVIPVINGCEDDTLTEVKKVNSPRIRPLYYRQSLGIDVPRAVGAKFAYNLGATAVLFMDGDMIGNLIPQINDLLNAVANHGVDLALTNCYPRKIYFKNSLAREVLEYRKKLNTYLDLYNEIIRSSPSHGPHAVSKNFLQQVPFQEIAIPPVTLTLARQKSLTIKVAATIAHNKLGSTIRDNEHGRTVGHTIIGDCIEAWQLYFNQPRDRKSDGITYQGYNASRRFDLLEDIDSLINQGIL